MGVKVEIIFQIANCFFNFFLMGEGVEGDVNQRPTEACGAGMTAGVIIGNNREMGTRLKPLHGTKAAEG